MSRKFSSMAYWYRKFSIDCLYLITSSSLAPSVCLRKHSLFNLLISCGSLWILFNLFVSCLKFCSVSGDSGYEVSFSDSSDSYVYSSDIKSSSSDITYSLSNWDVGRGSFFIGNFFLRLSDWLPIDASSSILNYCDFSVTIVSSLWRSIFGYWEFALSRFSTEFSS